MWPVSVNGAILHVQEGEFLRGGHRAWSHDTHNGGLLTSSNIWTIGGPCTYSHRVYPWCYSVRHLQSWWHQQLLWRKIKWERSGRPCTVETLRYPGDQASRGSSYSMLMPQDKKTELKSSIHTKKIDSIIAMLVPAEEHKNKVKMKSNRKVRHSYLYPPPPETMWQPYVQIAQISVLRPL
jgi:hypothetical protein